VDGCFVLFVAVFGAVVLGIWGWGLSLSLREEARRRESRAASASRWTDRLATEFRGIGLVVTEIHGRRADVRLERDRESGLRYTTVTVDLRGKSPGTLKIAPPGWASHIARMFGDQDILIGDRAFDDHFIIMANPESLAHRLFSVERRARMISAIRRIGRGWAPFIDLTREALHVGVVAELHSDRQIQDLLETARELVEAILEAGHTTGILWIGETNEALGQCLVCGSEMTEGIVHCAKCGTPHHEECWRYTGECSTYACQETAYLKDGRRVEGRPASSARILRIERMDDARRMEPRNTRGAGPVST
jgi:hypothetical protein